MLPAPGYLAGLGNAPLRWLLVSRTVTRQARNPSDPFLQQCQQTATNSILSSLPGTLDPVMGSKVVKLTITSCTSGPAVAQISADETNRPKQTASGPQQVLTYMKLSERADAKEKRSRHLKHQACNLYLTVTIITPYPLSGERWMGCALSLFTFNLL